MADSSAVTPDTEINIKVAIGGTNKKVKIPLRDLGPEVFPAKLRNLLEIPPSDLVTFERFSDSAGFFVLLDPNNSPVYKQLFRAAKAKLKLRIRATVTKAPSVPAPAQSEPTDEQPASATPGVSAPSEAPSQGNGLAPMSSIPKISAGPQVDSTFSTSSKPSLAASSQQQPSSSSVLIPGLSDGANSPDEEVKAPTNPLTEYERCLAELVRQNQEGLRRARVPQLPPVQLPESSYAVYCNACDAPIEDEHYHCSICDGGDFDLCLDCRASGQICDGDNHWLIKRNIQDGRIINSTTKTLPPRVQSKTCKLSDITTEPPKAGPKLGPKYPAYPVYEEARTCNSCVDVLPESKFVTCTVCDDFDLCLPCLSRGRHGHHPHHPFEPAASHVKLEPEVAVLCAAGRNVHHAALCDGCDKSIKGIRHKCLDCPDWDYCSSCFASAYFIHPGHRFCPVFGNLPPRRSYKERHSGILCDGPLCTGEPGQKSITGDRYKCTVCHDTDFCANCEASPANEHNKTHPLIKFKTPIRGVTVSTYDQMAVGEKVTVMGDRHASLVPEPAAKVETAVEPPRPEKVVSKPTSEVSEDLNARFLFDGTPDGTKMSPAHVFNQSWTLKNTGPGVWPAGCSVRFVGGDNMRNVDIRHPISVADLERSVESCVLPKALEVGETWTFSVTLKAPSRVGKFISYWRLTAPNGVKFGHKLWCDIDVTTETVQWSDLGLQNYQLELMRLEKQHMAVLQQRAAEAKAAREAQGIPTQEIKSELEADESCKSTADGEADLIMPPFKKEGGEKLIDLAEVKAINEPSKLGGEPAQGQNVSDEGTVENPSRQEDVVGEEKTDATVSESAMIFPTLDKESPVPSDDGAKTETADAEIDDLASEAASLTLEEEESEDDFLTDEEYDILDASDEEVPGSSAKGVSK